MKKKLLMGLFAATAAIGLASCNNTPAESSIATPTSEATPSSEVTPSAATEIDTMSYEQFMKAEAGDVVRIEAYIAAKQSWWDNKATVYLTGDKGEGYMIYEFAMTEEEFNTKYTIGTLVNVTASKLIYKGEHELDGKTITKVEVKNSTPKAAEPVDVTASVKNEDLEGVMNSFFTATLRVKEYSTTDTNTGVAENKAYGYKGDAPTSDLYIMLEDANGNVLNAVVQAYLTNKNSSVYKYVLENLKVGDLVKVTGYMYWWNGANPHIINITPQVDTEYEAFMATEVGENVEVTGKIYARQSWWDNAAILYVSSTSAGEGYVVYKMTCTEEQFNTDLVVGNVIKITGKKASYKGLEEISDATYTLVAAADKYNVSPVEITDYAHAGAMMGSSFVGDYTIVEYTNPASNTGLAESKAYAYKGDAPTSDLYIRAKDASGFVVEFCVPAYVLFTDFGTTKTALYDTVSKLAVGDTIRITGSVYWWNGANPHVFNITKA